MSLALLKALLWKFRWPLLGALLLALALWQLHAWGERKYEAGRASGEASEHAKWVADTKARDLATAEAIADQAAKEAADRKHADEVMNGYVKELAAANGNADQYRRLLRAARGEVRPSASTEAPSAICPTPAGEDAEAGRTDELLAGALAEADANASQLSALIDVVKGQL